MNADSKQAVTHHLHGYAVRALLISLTGCSASPPAPSGSQQPAPTGAELFALITETDPYEEWAQFPGVEGLVPSAPPHGPMARIFINRQVEDALGQFTGRLASGSMIVKENFGDGSSDKADSLTMMWKVDGYDPDNNDWFWANITPDGEINAQGMVAGCINCHAGARDNDFVFVHQF